MASNVSKSPIIAGLDRIAIVCNSPVCYGSSPDEKKDTRDYTLVNRPNEDAFLTAQYCGFNVVVYAGSDLGNDAFHESEGNTSGMVPGSGFDDGSDNDQYRGQWYTYMDEALKICQRLGLKLISNSPILNYNTQKSNIPRYASGWPGSFVEPFHNYSALAGWQIKDEPEFLNWHKYYVDDRGNTILPSSGTTDLKINYQKILEAIAASKTDQNQEGNSNSATNSGNSETEADKYGGKLVFMNLAFSNDTQWIGNIANYSAYLDAYIKEFSPSVLSYDYYPVDCGVDPQGNETAIHVNTNSFYQALEIFFQKSKQYV
ncbi:MAG: hypothetical protein ACI4AK_07265 [Lepagella sp.]